MYHCDSDSTVYYPGFNCAHETRVTSPYNDRTRPDRSPRPPAARALRLRLRMSCFGTAFVRFSTVANARGCTRASVSQTCGPSQSTPTTMWAASWCLDALCRQDWVVLSNRIETREGRGLFRIEWPSPCWCQPHYCGRRSAFRPSLAAVWSSLATTSPTSTTCQLVSAPPVVRRVVTDTLRMCGTGRPSLQAATAV